MITHIAKLLYTEIAEGEMSLRVVQVGEMPMPVPSTFKVARTENGNLRFRWQWLPGEPWEEEEFARDEPLGVSFELLLVKLRQSKPWRLGWATPG